MGRELPKPIRPLAIVRKIRSALFPQRRRAREVGRSPDTTRARARGGEGALRIFAALPDWRGRGVAGRGRLRYKKSSRSAPASVPHHSAPPSPSTATNKANRTGRYTGDEERRSPAMDSDYGVPRELSEVQKKRTLYRPEVPPCLQVRTAPPITTDSLHCVHHCVPCRLLVSDLLTGGSRAPDPALPFCRIGSFGRRGCLRLTVHLLPICFRGVRS